MDIAGAAPVCNVLCFTARYIPSVCRVFSSPQILYSISEDKLHDVSDSAVSCFHSMKEQFKRLSESVGSSHKQAREDRHELQFAVSE